MVIRSSEVCKSKVSGKRMQELVVIKSGQLGKLGCLMKSSMNDNDVLHSDCVSKKAILAEILMDVLHVSWNKIF